jgi:hypothetical protein
VVAATENLKRPLSLEARPAAVSREHALLEFAHGNDDLILEGFMDGTDPAGYEPS